MKISSSKYDIYCYPYGKIKILEQKLLSIDRIMRLSDAKTIDEFFALLKETHYKDYIEPMNFEQGLYKFLDTTYTELEKFVPEQTLLKVFISEYEYHNLKLIIKEKLFGYNLANIIIGIGEIKNTYNLLKKVSLKELPTHLPVYSNAINSAVLHYTKTQNVVYLECAIDSEYLKHLNNVVNTTDWKIIKDILNIYITIGNIKILLRAKNTDMLKFLTQPTYSKYYSTDIKKMITDMKDLCIYEPILSKAIKYYFENNSWLMLEKASDKYIIQELKKLKHNVSIEPIIHYFLSIKNELKILKMIYKSKIYNLEEDIWAM